MALSIEELKVVNWVEEYWLRKHVFPPVDQLKGFFPNFDLTKSLTNETFLSALDNRGISLPQANSKLSSEQLASIALLSNFRDPRTPTAKLRSIGVSWTKWNGWMRDKHFKEYMQDLCAVNFNDSLDIVQTGILKAAEKGNVDAAKFFLEVTGRYTPQSQEVANLKLVLSRILETIQIHVKDPETLRAIANDFEKVLAGGVPEQPKQLML
jgi:hypothetical protein